MLKGSRMTRYEESKQSIRARYKSIRSELSIERRREASLALQVCLREREMNGTVLSFVSNRDEIETKDINRWLAESGRLVLPKVEEDELHLYRVVDLESDLIGGGWGIAEPNPSRAVRVADSEVAFALVPGLVFDERGHRLGYGNGYYDRLLSRMLQVRSIGVGFREQLRGQPLPVTGHDIAVSELILV
jgi:5-formyltetrahydrofolate cyclo-ligase